MHGSKLIRRSYSGPHLTCIKYPQTLEVLCKIHDGECGNHSGGRSLAQKTLNVGYFWHTMRHDSAEYVKRCDRCQRYKPIPNLPAEVYHPQNSPWPFMQWAIDLVGPLPPAPAKKEMMIVATDYFTKWIEAEALSSTKEADVERFIWRNIICPQNTTVVHKQRPSGDAAHKKRPKGDAGCARNFLREERPKGDAGRRLKASVWRRSPLKKRPKGDAGCARNFLKGGLHASCGKYPERPKGDAGRRLKASVWRRSPLKKRPKGDAGCARNFLKGGLHASCGKYPGSYPFPKGGRIVTQLPISSVLREAQGDDQANLRDMQNTSEVLQEEP
ncbi:unnamed protein product [Prunus armeniaca]